MHGTIDGTVKYNRGFCAPFGIPLIMLDGSRMLNEQALAVGVSNPFYTWYGQDHVPYAGSTLYMDSTIKFVRDFLIANLGCSNPALIPPNAPAQTATLYPYTTCTTNVTMNCSMVGINELSNYSIISEVYPNPAENEITIVFQNSTTKHFVTLFDLAGKLILTDVTGLPVFNIKNNNSLAGLYF